MIKFTLIGINCCLTLFNNIILRKGDIIFMLIIDNNACKIYNDF